MRSRAVQSCWQAGTDRPGALFFLRVLDKHCSTVVTTSTLLLKTFHGGF
jgi:hypothetical protein